MENAQGLEPGAEHRHAVDSEPALEHRRIDPPEVGVVFQSAGLQVGEARVPANQPARDPAPREEERGGGAVVGAVTAVLASLSFPAERLDPLGRDRCCS